MGSEYFVYVLRDDEGNLYKGMTCDLQRRFSEHEKGRTQTTSRMHLLEIVYTEKYECRADARKREIYLKTAAGRRFLKKILQGP